MDGCGLRVWRRAALSAVLFCCVTATPALASPQQAQVSLAQSRLAPAAAPAGQATGAQTVMAGRRQTPVSLSITAIAPRTVTARSKITLQGHVVNRSGQPLAGVRYRLRYSNRAVVSRGRLAQLAQSDVAALPGVTADQMLGDGTLAAGDAQVPWKIQVAAKSLHLENKFGTFPIGVEFYTQAGQVLAGQVTFLVWQPPGRKWFKKTSIGWVWPLADRMHRSADHIFLDDRLETDLSPNGRLGRLVAAAESTDTPLTWAIDPALLDDARAMTASKGYTVRPPGRAPAKKPASATARAWLDRLKRASSRDSYFALPYADVDADALVRNDLTGHLKAAYNHRRVAQEVLGRPADAQIAWPVPGVSENRTLAWMSRLGSDTFLMSSAVFPPAGNVTYTPSATASLPTPSGPRPVVVYDQTLSKIVSVDTTDPGQRLLAEQRFLAETAMITAELPQLARTIVIAPSRYWNPGPQFAEHLLEWTAKASWLRPAKIGDIARARPQQLTFTGYPDSYAAYELGPKYLGEVRKIAGRANGFAAILNPVSYPHARAILRMESGSWRGSRTLAQRARSARDQLGDHVAAEINRVGLARRDNVVQLAGRTGNFLLTINNELSDRSVRLRIEITPRIPARLQIGEYESDIVLGPNERASIDVEVESFAQGPTQVDVKLLTPEGKTYRTHVLTINTTGYGTVALLITGGSLAVLFVGVGFRAMRARRRNKMEASGDGSPGGESPWAQAPGRPTGG
nr:DUF6049 family protein [Thermomonospora sp. CIF 1]